MTEAASERPEQRTPAGWYPAFGKRMLDLALVIPATVVLMPVMLAIAVKVRKHMGSPALFRQTRAGRHGKAFEVLKFRTMTDERRPDGSLADDGERLTPLGRVLREASLDELPSLFNVLRGEMSLVGPRPLHVRYLERYTPEQNRRHMVRPGLTGWAAVMGRNALSWDEKFQLDVHYVDNVSIAVDLEILARTLVAVVRRDGINQEGQATMEEFWGSEGK